MSYPFARLPAVAVDDLVEGAAVRVPDQRERLIRRVAKRNQVGAEPVLGKTEQVARHVLVADCRVAASDAAASMMLIVAWPRSYCRRSRCRSSFGGGAISAIVAAAEG